MKTHHSLHTIENFTGNMSCRMIIHTAWNCWLESHTNGSPKQYSAATGSISSFQIWEFGVTSLEILIEIDERLTRPTTIHMGFEVRLLWLQFLAHETKHQRTTPPLDEKTQNNMVACCPGMVCNDSQVARGTDCYSSSFDSRYHLQNGWINMPTTTSLVIWRVFTGGKGFLTHQPSLIIAYPHQPP